MATTNTDHLVKIPEFALLKGTTRLRIYQLITAQVIVPEVIGNVQFINTETYKDFDPKARVKREESLKEILKQHVDLKQRLTKLEHVVYQTSAKKGPYKKNVAAGK